MATRPPATPEPPRTLATPGRGLWQRYANDIDHDTLLPICEMTDEQYMLRLKVLRDGQASDRRALRYLDRALADAMTDLNRRRDWAQYAQEAQL